MLEGNLQQQCVDESGLFEWVNKKFTLRKDQCLLEIKLLENSSEKKNVMQCSLIGARYALEWAVSSAIAGFGFDIIWTR